MLEKRLRDGLIVEEVRKGKLSIAKVANMFGVGTSTAWKACEAAGVKSTAPYPHIKAERNARIVKAIKNGNTTLQEVGDKFGISRERVRQICAREGVYSLGDRPCLSTEEQQTIESLWFRGVRPAHMGLERAHGTITGYLARKGLRDKENDMTAWTDDEIVFLKKNYGMGDLSGADIAQKLGRTRNEVIGKAHRLGLRAINRHNETPLTFKGETRNLSEWAKRVGLHRVTLHSRLNAGWTPEQALGIKAGIRRDGVTRA